MRYITLILATAAAAAAPHVADAATSNFARDRNIAVTQRQPKEYMPLGLHAGAFDVSPKVDFVVTTHDNIFYRPTAKVADTVLTVSPSLAIKSNWGRHAVSGVVGASYDNYVKTTSENTLDLNAGIAGRLDYHGNSNAFGGLSFSRNHEPLYDPSRPQSAAKPVEYGAANGNIGFLAEGNRLRFTGTFNFSKLDYKDVASVSGGTIDQDTRDYSKTGLTGRADYAVSPDTSIYFTYTANKRDYRLSSVARDSHGFDMGVGSSFDITNLVRGEVQIGYLEQTYKNPAFKHANGGSLKAKVEYFPTQLLTVNFSTARTIEETPAVGIAGYLSTNTSVGADYEALRNLIISASYAQINDGYSGADRDDHRKNFNVGAKYLMSRNVVIRAGYNHSENNSRGSAAIASYKDNTFKISLGYQY